MNNLKKIIGIFVLTFFMIVSFDIVQAAAPERLEEATLGTLDTEQATITVTNTEAGDELSAYKILDIYKNSVTNEINYRYTDNFYAFLENGGSSSKDYSHLTEEEYLKLTSGDITSGSTQTNSTLDVLVSEYAAYIYNNKITGAALSKSGDAMSLTTTTGAYLILPWKSDSLYAVMVGNLDYKEVNGEWVKQNSTIVAKASKPYLNASVGKIGQKEASYIIGEEYTYYVEAALPLFPTNSKIEFENGPGFSTYLGKGITFQGLDTLEISLGDTKLSLTDENTTLDGDYFTHTATIMNGDVTIGSFKITNKGRAIELGKLTCMDIYLNDSIVTNQKILLSFNAKLNEKVELCRKQSQLEIDSTTSFSLYPSNVMSSGFVFPHAYDENGELYYDYNDISIDSNTYIFTYKTQINKHVLGDPTKKLGGAVFEIYSDSGLTKKVGSVTTDDNGFAEFSGLGEGKYYLKEVTAPTGYSLLKLPTEIEIKYDESLIDSETGEYCGPAVDISNTKISALPITGGMGTIIYTIVGILLIGSAAIGITYYKKNNKNLV